MSWRTTLRGGRCETGSERGIKRRLRRLKRRWDLGIESGPADATVRLTEAHLREAHLRETRRAFGAFLRAAGWAAAGADGRGRRW
jgi:hypothetical protein